jgi:hypothetical protein
VSYSNRPFAAARNSPYIKALQRESCQLKTAVRIAALSEIFLGEADGKLS